MSSFLLSLTSKERDIVSFEVSEGYSFSPKKYYSIKKVSIYDPSRVENIISNKYRIKYQRLTKIIKDLFESDDSSESDYMICLDEIAKLKDILLLKYQKFLKKKKFEMFLNNLLLIENVLQERIIEMRNNDIIKSSGGRR